MSGKPKVIDLFCGIGGFSKGFEMAGFDVLFGIDNWEVAINTFKNNHNNTKGILVDLTELDDDFFSQYECKVDVIIAGPPCQGFSMCGKREVGDKRNELFNEVAGFSEMNVIVSFKFSLSSLYFLLSNAIINLVSLSNPSFPIAHQSYSVNKFDTHLK